MLPTLRTRAPRLFRAFPEIRYDFDRWFDDFFTRPLYRWEGVGPAADFFETDDEYVVELDLPGWERKDIEVTVEQGILTIAGEKSEEKEEERPTYHLRERSKASFTRTFSVPHTIEAKAVNAAFMNGVLRVTMPKVAEAKARRIEVAVK